MLFSRFKTPKPHFDPEKPFHKTAAVSSKPEQTTTAQLSFS